MEPKGFVKGLRKVPKGARVEPVKPTTTPQSNGPRIEDLRWDRRLSVSALAEKAGTTPQHLRRVIKGQRVASLELQGRISDALEVPIEEIQQDAP